MLSGNNEYLRDGCVGKLPGRTGIKVTLLSHALFCRLLRATLPVFAMFSTDLSTACLHVQKRTFS